MRASSPLLAPVAAALLAGCAHGEAAPNRELAELRARVLRLQDGREEDRRRIEALEAQLAAMARRLSAPPRPAPEVPPVHEIAPPTPPTPEATLPTPDGDDGFVFIVDHGDGHSGGASRPPRQARRSPGGVDAAPPLPTEIELRDPEDEAAAYEAGLAALRAGAYAEAAQKLEAFLAASPRNPLADNATLALGEALIGQGLPGRALQAWERVATDYPAGDAVPEALLRYAETCSALGRHAAARAAYERLQQNHPGTEAAARASARLAEGR